MENRADLLARGFPGRSDASLGVIFHLHPAPGFHRPRLAFAFLQIYCLRHRLFLCVTPFYYKDSAKKSQGLGGQIPSFLLDPRTVSSDPEAIGSHRRLQHGPCRASVCLCAEVIPAAADFMPSRIHAAPETIIAGVEIIPAVIPEKPAILHPAVLIKVIPVPASIIRQIFPFSMGIRTVVIAEPPAVQTPGSLCIPVSASGSNGFLCVTLCMVKTNGDPMGIKTVNTSSDL